MTWLSSFRDRAVLGTGASSGIGRAVALTFAAAGAPVGLVARRRELLEEVARLAGGETLVLPADVTRPDDVRVGIRRGHGALRPARRDRRMACREPMR